MEETDKKEAGLPVDSEKLSQLLFELLADEVHVWRLVRDENGAIKTWRLVDVNPAALKGWGRSRDEVIGKTPNEIFDNTDAVAQFMPIVQKIFIDGAPHQWEAYFAGTNQHLQMTSFPAGEYFITTGVNITEQKRAEAMLRESQTRQMFLARLADTLRPLTDPAAIEKTFSQALGNYLDGAAIWMVLVHGDDTATVTTDSAPTFGSAVPKQSDSGTFSTIVESVRRGRTFVVRDAAHDLLTEEERHAVAELHAKALIAAPIFANDKLAAMLCVSAPITRDWTGAEVRLVEETAKRVWPDLQRAQAEQALRVSAERQAFLLKLSDRVRPVTDPAIIEEIITQATMAFFNANRCFYTEITDGYALTRREAARDDLYSVVGHYPLDELPLFNTVIAAGRPFVVHDAHVTDLLDASLLSLCIELQIISFIDVPVMKMGKPVGLLSISQSTPRVWTDDDVTLAVEIAERTWTAVQRGAAEAALRHMNEALEKRVADRTAALLDSNKRLELEVAERTKVENALRQSEAHLEEAQRIAHVGSWEWVAATDTPTWSAELCRILEVDPDKPVPGMAEQGKLYTSESMVHLRAAVAHTMQSGEPYEVELERVREDGSRRWLLSRGEQWRDERGQLIGLRGTALEITERKLAEEALQQSKTSLEKALAKLKETQTQMLHHERLVAVGQLSAGIAHDFNNILTSILSLTSLLHLAPEMPETLKPELEMIAASGKQATQMVRQLLDFSQKTIRRPQQLELDALLREQVAFLQRTIPENIEITLNSPPGDYIIEGDVTQLQQLITNLMVNARDAMPNGGKLQIDLSRLVTTGQEICVFCNERITDAWLVLTVTDDGVGMDEKTQAHIFEPFFTTKEVHQGTGLGLAQVAGIMKQHSGHITVDSRIGQGTAFTIYLPPVVKKHVAEIEKAPSTILSGQGQIVLLVDDNPIVVEAVKLVLEHLQYRVITAVNGRDALTAYAEHQTEIALVLSDMVMPDMDGEALFRALKTEDSDVNMALMSGYPLGDKGVALLAQGLVAWMQKPFSLEALSQVLDKALS